MATQNMTFAPKGAETLQAEILADLGVEYDGNEEMVDKLVARGLKDEEVKASLHGQKTDTQAKLKETRKLAGLDPETGEKPATNVVVEPPKSEGLSISDVVSLRDMHEDDALWLAEEAKLRGKSIPEMKADSYTKIILQAKADERKTAEATNTGSSRKSNSKSDEASLLNRADSGKLADDEMGSAAQATIKKIFSGR